MSDLAPDHSPDPLLPPGPAPKQTDPAADHKPLSEAERVEMLQLLRAFRGEPPIPGQPAPPPPTPENYARLKELHARAKYEADNWHEDGEAVDRESAAAFDLVIQAIRIIVATVPAAAAANQVLVLMNDSHARMKTAMTPPPPAPDLPPDPAEVAAEQKAAEEKAEAAA